MGCLERGADTQQSDEQHRVELHVETKYNLCEMHSQRRSDQESQVKHAARSQRTAGVPASDNLALDGRMGFGDAAAADAGEPHASREAVRVRTGPADAPYGHSSRFCRVVDRPWIITLTKVADGGGDGNKGHNVQASGNFGREALER